MMQEDKSAVRLRPLKAVAIVLAILVMVPGVDAVVHTIGASDNQGAAFVGLDASAFAASDDAYVFADKLEEAANANIGNPPSEFSREIGLLAGARDVRVYESGRVVGYVLDDESQHVVELLKKHMEQRGWTSVDLGGYTGATFVKDEGECKWALATCNQVGSATSVVMTCVYQKG